MAHTGEALADPVVCVVDSTFKPHRKCKSQKAQRSRRESNYLAALLVCTDHRGSTLPSVSTGRTHVFCDLSAGFSKGQQANTTSITILLTKVKTSQRLWFSR